MRQLKILTFDIETAPSLAYVWGVWKTNVSTEMMLSETYVLTWAAKWLHNKKVMGMSLRDTKAFTKDKENDKELLIELVKLIDEADIVVGHNIRRFDLAIINARCLKHGIKRPTPPAIIDTLEAVKSLKFPHKSLKGLAKSLELDDQKGDPGGISTWMDIITKDKTSAWNAMLKYNKLDVTVNEQLYMKLRPFIKSHPPVGEEGSCPTCGSFHHTVRSKSVFHGGIPRQAMECKDCKSLYFAFKNGRTKSI